MVVEINFRGKPWADFSQRLGSGIAHRSRGNKLTVDRFSINFRGRKRNGSVETFPLTFNGISFLPPPRNSCCSSFKLP